MPQYLVGLSFLTERVSTERRKQLVPVHSWFGRATFLLGIGTAMVGIQVCWPAVLACRLTQCLLVSFLTQPATDTLLLPVHRRRPHSCIC